MKHKRTKHTNTPRRSTPKAQAAMVLGIAWYHAEQWQRFRSLATDRDALHDTYAEWETAATEKLGELRALGINAQPYWLMLTNWPAGVLIITWRLMVRHARSL